MKIRETDVDIAQAASRVMRARDFVEGEDAVKRRSEIYLPRNSADQPDTSYKAMKELTTFYPAANRTLDGLAGLIFRKPPVLSGATPAMERICQTINVHADDLNTFSYDLVRETLTTNFSGILVDMPDGEADARLSPDAAVDADMRPFVSLYVFESIKSRTYDVYKGRKRLTSVVLEDDCDNWRELRLIDGAYWVIKHKKNENGVWSQKTVQPLRAGKPLDHIPFYIITNSKGRKIAPSHLSYVVDLNRAHYLNEGLIAISKLFQAAPQAYVWGIDLPTDDKGEPIPPVVSPGTVWTNPSSEVKAGYLEYQGKGLEDLRADRLHLEEQMSIVGARIIASEKIAAEAAETLAIRRASENSALATTANLVSKQIEAALNEVADWMGLPNVTFQLNTDFLPQPMTAAELQAHVSALQAGAMSHETFFYALRDGDLLNPTLTYEEERKRLQNDRQLGFDFTVKQAVNDVPAELPRNDKAAPLA